MIGTVSFGGGSGMIPLITEEVIGHGWLTQEEVLNFIAVAESTPGPIAINMATFIGSSQGATLGIGLFGNFLGALLSTVGVVLPAFTIILVVATIIKGLLKFAGVKGFLSGVRPVVIGLIFATGVSLLLTVVLSLKNVYNPVSFDYKALIIFAVVAITHIVYKIVAKKRISAILLILLSAVLGIVLYGLV